MNCREFATQWRSYLADGLTPQAGIDMDRHLNGCAHCGQFASRTLAAQEAEFSGINAILKRVSVSQAGGISMSTSNVQRLNPGRASKQSQRKQPDGRRFARRSETGWELKFAAAVLGVLLVATVYFACVRRQEENTSTAARIALERAENENFARGKAVLERAENAGQRWILGQDVSPSQLLDGFRNDPQIYNVVFTRSMRDKKGKEESSQIALDPQRLLVSMVTCTRDEKQIHMTYALADNQPIVMATLNFHPADDFVHGGGTITVMVRAQPDAHFQQVLKGLKQ